MSAVLTSRCATEPNLPGNGDRADIDSGELSNGDRRIGCRGQNDVGGGRLLDGPTAFYEAPTRGAARCRDRRRGELVSATQRCRLRAALRPDERRRRASCEVLGASVINSGDAASIEPTGAPSPLLRHT